MERAQEDQRKRGYRSSILKNNLTVFNVTIGESDLFVSTDFNLYDAARSSLLKHRSYLETYIISHPDFLTSLVPVQYDNFAPEIIRDMMAAAFQSRVGPMAAVAGAVSEQVARDLLNYSRNVIIENGGDIFIQCQNDIRVGIYAGNSPLHDKITLIVRKEEMPLGICTSSGTIGHSLSFGRADAVCIKAKSVALADAAATSICNRVKSKRDIHQALRAGMMIAGVLGIVVIIGDQFGVIGDCELAEK